MAILLLNFKPLVREKETHVSARDEIARWANPNRDRPVPTRAGGRCACVSDSSPVSDRALVNLNLLYGGTRGVIALRTREILAAMAMRPV